MKELTNEEIQQIYDYSKSKSDICKKLNIRTNQNGIKIDNDILEYSNQGIETKVKYGERIGKVRC